MNSAQICNLHSGNRSEAFSKVKYNLQTNMFQSFLMNEIYLNLIEKDFTLLQSKRYIGFAFLLSDEISEERNSFCRHNLRILIEIPSIFKVSFLEIPYFAPTSNFNESVN